MTQFNKTNEVPVLTALTADQVTDYLRRHPDFLADKPVLLADMIFPHNEGASTVSLVERQISVLRDRNMSMRHRLDRLLDNAHTNDVLFDKTRQLVLGLLDTCGYEQCLQVLFRHFYDEFEVHYARLLLMDIPNGGFPVVDNADVNYVDREMVENDLSRLILNHHAVCGQLDLRERELVFGEQIAGATQSSAIVPLRLNNCFFGILAIANRDPDYYHSSMNTLFLCFIGDVLIRILSGYLIET